MTDENKEMLKVQFIGENSVSDAIRCMLPAVELAKMQFADVSYNVIPWQNEPPPPIAGLDAVIMSRPHHDTLLMAYKRMGVPVVVDMDDDFRAIPENHPGYQYVGEGNPYMLAKLENCINLANRLVVATEELKERLVNHRMGAFDSIHVIPNGWSSRDPHWLDRRSIYKDKIIIGWGGTITHREDFQMCVKPLKKIMREHPEVIICIAGDPEIYQMFATVQEKQKLFVPMVPYDLYPITLSLWDILLAPLLNSDFNMAKSDIKLVDAGAKGIPYVASDMPVYRPWHKGEGNFAGILSNDDDWYENLKYLILAGKEGREKMGKAGKKAATTREMIELGPLWKNVIELAIADLDEGLY